MQQNCVSKVTVTRMVVAVIMFYLDRFQSLVKSHSPNKPCGMWFGQAITLIASQDASSQLLQPATAELQVVQQQFGCHQEWYPCILSSVRPCAYIKAVTIPPLCDNWHLYPSQTHTSKNLRCLQTLLLPCMCPAVLLAPFSQSSSPTLSCFASSPVLSRKSIFWHLWVLNRSLGNIDLETFSGEIRFVSL